MNRHHPTATHDKEEVWWRMRRALATYVDFSRLHLNSPSLRISVLHFQNHGLFE
jgi:hypothetical protein